MPMRVYRKRKAGWLAASHPILCVAFIGLASHANNSFLRLLQGWRYKLMVVTA